MEEQQLDIENMSESQLIMFALGDKNPGAYTVVSKLFSEFGEDESKLNKIMNFIKKLLERDIVGARLWYIYKNEAELNINKLFELNLDSFDNEYFYEKFEKYCS